MDAGGQRRSAQSNDKASPRGRASPAANVGTSRNAARDKPSNTAVAPSRERLRSTETAEKVHFAEKFAKENYFETVSLHENEGNASTTNDSVRRDRNDLTSERKLNILPQIKEERERRGSIYINDAYTLARRGSIMADSSDPSVRSSLEHLTTPEYTRRASIRQENIEAFFRRRETIDGGVLKQLIDYLKTKSGHETDDMFDVLTAASFGPSSASSLLSSLGTVETNPMDPHSFSRCDYVYVDRVEINWTIDFENEVVRGEVNLQVRRRKPGSTTLSLDTYLLDIERVKVNGKVANYLEFPHKGDFGARLDVELPDPRTDGYDVYMKYSTNRHATGLQWLHTNHHDNEKQPFVFSQCDSIQCRSILPIQDTPSNKVKYTARVTAPTGMKVLMSAPRERQFAMHPDGRSTHYFRQDTPVPPYLIAFAVGHITYARISERTVVWAVLESIEKMKRELSCVEDFLCVAETICGQYTWGKYDILVLPESEFSLSAMENPSLTLVNPTLVSGDGCMPMYIAHEIAHSWMGNLVTHMNYEHLWLSEGFANYVGRKILGKKYGPEARLFAAARGYKDLQMVVDIYGETHPLTCLVADLAENKPRETIHIIPYEKGHTLLYYLEQLIGGPYEMDQYIKEYIASFKCQSINSTLFQNHFTQFFSKTRALQQVDWNTWFNSPGMPPFRPDYHTSLEESCAALKEMWQQWDRRDKCPFREGDLSLLSPMQVLEFLSQMLESPPLPVFKLEAMDVKYKLDEFSDNDARLKWFLLCLRSHWRKKVEPALVFAKEDGRQFCVLAVFHELTQWEEMREEAAYAFNRIKNSVSRSTLKVLSTLLRVDSTEEAASSATRRRSSAVGSAEKRTDEPPTGRRKSIVAPSPLEDAPPILHIRRKSVFHPPPAGVHAPSPSGSAQPSPAGSAQPSPAGSAQPSPAGSAQPSPAGSRRTSYQASQFRAHAPVHGQNRSTPTAVGQGRPSPHVVGQRRPSLPSGKQNVTSPSSPATPHEKT